MTKTFGSFTCLNFIKFLFLFCGLIFLLSSTTFAVQADKTIILELSQEALMLESSQKKQWENYLKEVEKIFLENAQERANWLKRGAPPLPNIENLNLPLAFLARGLERNNILDYPKYYAYLVATANHSDKRRVELYVAYSEKLQEDRNFSYHFPSLMAKAADLDWACQEIPNLIKKENYISTYSLLFALLEKFAIYLPKEIGLISYDHIRHYWPKGPNNGDGERYWDLLIRLDSKRACREIILYFNNYDCDLYVVRILEKYATPSQEMAQIARKWLAKTKAVDYEIYGTQLRILLLKSDPQKELPQTLNLINKHILRLKKISKPVPNISPEKEINRTEKYLNQAREPEGLIEAIIELDINEAIEAFASYVHKKEIDDIVRFKILEWLVKHQYAHLPNILARWLREEEYYSQKWLTEAATKKWGKFGQEILEKAQQLLVNSK